MKVGGNVASEVEAIRSFGTWQLQNHCRTWGDVLRVEAAIVREYDAIQRTKTRYETATGWQKNVFGWWLMVLQKGYTKRYGQLLKS